MANSRTAHCAVSGSSPTGVLIRPTQPSILKREENETSHLGQNLIFTARIIAKSHAKGTQGGTPVPRSDHLVRALLGCQTREIVPTSWLILSDFFRFF